MKDAKKAPGDKPGGMDKSQFDSSENSENDAPAQDEAEALAGLYAHIRASGEAARDKVAKWNGRVEKWRARNGDEFIPRKVFEQHPAAEMLAGIFEQSNIVEREGALELASRVLSVSNDGLRSTSELSAQFAAQMFDIAHQTENPAASYCKARLWGVMGQVCGLLLELRTTTSEEIHGLPVADIPGCILARTADVRESGDHA